MNRAKILLLGVALVAALFAAGCGTADINFHTIVHSSGEITQEVNLEATGLMAESFKESTANMDEAEAEGWEITIEETDETISLKMSKRFSREEAESMVIPLAGPGGVDGDQSDETTPTLNFDIQESFFSREFALSISMPASETQPSSDDQDGDDEFAEMGEELLQALEDSFSFSWAITLPGEITETNADEQSGNTATWNLSFSSVSEAQEFVVKSQETNWLNIGLIVGGLGIIVIGGIAFFLIRR